ncbi:oxidoreductase [Skermanella stibiiresistens SB22]|uniref:Oxidoreductase n=1 Tax=Skermanella stibiiresistens SB22 TaxID=1385369 RepID=W9H8I0_9PROT|nr:3-oxoacyl-ACP reductase family protein [Skermanella stibiiresistens]EWY41061.1 oxidoreductase [Skermanella stibiiresistens SB22]
MKRLQDKAAIVTGGGGGICSAICETFAREGASVVVADFDLGLAEAVANRIREQGGRAMACRVDVGDKDSAYGLIDTCVQEFGSVDILVNGAGISVNELFIDTSIEDWERVQRVNLTGAFLCGQAAARKMIKRRSGRIINIVSLSGQRGGFGRSAYGSSKAGLEILTKIMAVELSHYGINVNAVAPGPIDTPMTKIVHDEATRQSYYNLTPMRRYGTPEEIADAMVFLASDESQYVQGHTLNVDGGFGAAGLIYELKPKTMDDSPDPASTAG